MIAFGACRGTSDAFDRIALPGIEACREPDSGILVAVDRRSIFAAYNDLLARASEFKDLEALVLLHDDVAIEDDRLCSKLRSVFRDPSVALAGVIGATDCRSIAWWRYDVRGRVREVRASTSEPPKEILGRVTCESCDVDILDGVFIALSPWAVNNLRFDERNYRGFHGYDADISMQAIARGKRAIVTDIRCTHHTTAPVLARRRDLGAWRRADLVWQAKWREASTARRMVLRARARVAPLYVSLARPRSRQPG